MSRVFSFTILIFLSSLAFAAIEHTQSINQRPDGKFDVTCIDGNVEVKTKDDIVADKVCTAFNTVTGDWRLSDGGNENGVRWCDLNVSLMRTHDAIFRMNALFKPPCNSVRSEAQECTGYACSIRLDQKFYSFDFATTGRLILTRLSDGFQAGYRGTAGTGGTGGHALSRTRTIPVSGVDDVLQVTNDDGANWSPVCDDEFSQAAAEVACRDMGFSSVKEFKTDIFVSGSSSFGLDDVTCTGTEPSLFECKHLDWGQHNCGSSEHVQLTCNP